MHKLMTSYIQFTTADQSTILVEVEDEEVYSPPGVEKAGLGDRLNDGVIAAQRTFEEAVQKTIKNNVEAFVTSVQSLSTPPTEVEITFGLKVTGEVGNVAVGKAGGEVNYSVKLAWKGISQSP